MKKQPEKHSEPPPRPRAAPPLKIIYMPSGTINFVGTLSLGAGWNTSTQQQTLTLQPNVLQTFVTQAGHSFFNSQLFLAHQQTLRDGLWGQIGLDIGVTNPINVHGTIWDDANSANDNYTYSYQLQHTHFNVKGKLLLNPYVNSQTLPWISAGLGVALNEASGYQDTPLSTEAVVNPYFSNANVAAFNFTVGAGLQRIVAQHWQVGIGYEFADWGSYHLGPIPLQTLSNGLSGANFYTSNVLASATYVM